MFQVYSVNEALKTWRPLRSFGSFAEAEKYAYQWFGRPDRTRSFAYMAVVRPDRSVTVVVRGEA